MPIISTIRMTADQYFRLGADPPGVRLELVDGEIAVAPSPTPEHSKCDNRFRVLLTSYVDRHDLGDVFGDLDTPLDLSNVRRPDVLYFSKSRLHLVTRTRLMGPPDLCVEIVSPTSSAIDRVDKFTQYAKAGVAHYWILDPIARSLEGFELHGSGYVLSGEGRNDEVLSLPPFPKLKVRLSKLWWAGTSSDSGRPKSKSRRTKKHRATPSSRRVVS